MNAAYKLRCRRCGLFLTEGCYAHCSSHSTSGKAYASSRAIRQAVSRCRDVGTAEVDVVTFVESNAVNIADFEVQDS